MSQLIITRNALQHIESRIGDGAECEILITDQEIRFRARYKNNGFEERVSFLQFFKCGKTSGQWLREFEKNACDHFAGNSK